MIIRGDSIGETYYNAFDAVLTGKNRDTFLTVQINKPFKDKPTKFEGEAKSAIELLDPVLNLDDEVYQPYSKFKFSKAEGNTGGYTGKDWINGMVIDLLAEQGYYNRALTKLFGVDQLALVESRLKARDKNGNIMNGGSGNGLVCQVYSPTEDLKRAAVPRPRAGGLRCLTQIDFKPHSDNLDLHAVYRSQYFDIKAYGNYISLAALLYSMGEKTGYKPRHVICTANNTTFSRERKEVKKLYKSLKDFAEYHARADHHI